MKKHIVLIILGGALLMIGIILSFNKKNEIIYYYDEVELSQEEASSLILEKTRNIVDIYENKDNTFKLVEEKKEEPQEPQDTPEGEEVPKDDTPSEYVKASDYEEVVNKLFTEKGIKELEGIKFGDKSFVNKQEDGSIYLLRTIPSDNSYLNCSISIKDILVNLDEIKATVTFSKNTIDKKDNLTYFVYEKSIDLIKKDDNWLVNSFVYTNK